MKQKYVKPAMVMERFELAQSVAAGGCGAASSSTMGDPNQWNKETCGWDLGNMIVWTELNSGCLYKLDEDFPMEGVCYNNPDGGQSIFNS